MKAIVTITGIGFGWVNYTDSEGISFSSDDSKFPPFIKVGHVFELEVKTQAQYPVGVIMSSRLLSPARKKEAVK